MITGGVNASKITLVGHSLGAHIAGIAGKQVYKRTGQLLSRITALDPAGPCFSNIHVDGKLVKNDANYVDVIHTNGGMLGLKESMGNDFKSCSTFLIFVFIRIFLDNILMPCQFYVMWY